MSEIDEWLEEHKHLTGQHDQKRHGWRGAKNQVTQAAARASASGDKSKVQQEDKGGRAAGGVITVGINDKTYLGGQFLPNTPEQIAAQYGKKAAKNAMTWMERKQEVAPYEWEQPSTPLERAIFTVMSGQMRDVYFDRNTKQWKYDSRSRFVSSDANGKFTSNPLDKEMVWTKPDGTKLSAKQVLDIYNAGVRFLETKMRADELLRLASTGTTKINAPYSGRY